MNKQLLASTALLAASALPLSAQALPFGLSAAAKLGVYQFEPDDSAADTDPALMLSGRIGYEILDLAAVSVDLEAELSTTLNDISIDSDDFSSDIDASALTAGIFAAARTLGPVYAIGKLGYINSDFNLDGAINTDIDESGAAVGLGVGFGAGIKTEIELTRHEIDGSEAYYLSVSFGL